MSVPVWFYMPLLLWPLAYVSEKKDLGPHARGSLCAGRCRHRRPTRLSWLRQRRRGARSLMTILPMWEALTAELAKADQIAAEREKEFITAKDAAAALATRLANAK